MTFYFAVGRRVIWVLLLFINLFPINFIPEYVAGIFHHLSYNRLLIIIISIKTMTRKIQLTTPLLNFLTTHGNVAVPPV